jgi:hypothetical protein
MTEMKEYTPLDLLKSNMKGKRDLAIAYRADIERYAKMADKAEREANEYQSIINKIEGNLT